jgi:hypothetical protein
MILGGVLANRCARLTSISTLVTLNREHCEMIWLCLATVAEESHHAVRQFQHLRQLRFLGGADEFAGRDCTADSVLPLYRP